MEITQTFASTLCMFLYVLPALDYFEVGLSTKNVLMKIEIYSNELRSQSYFINHEHEEKMNKYIFVIISSFQEKKSKTTRTLWYTPR